MEDEPEQEPIDVVLSVGELDRAIVALREFLHRSGAVEMQALVDRGERAPAHIALGQLSPIEVVDEDRTVHLPHAVELEGDPPDLGVVPRLPPLEVDAREGVVTGPLGGVEALARGLELLAESLGGRSVAVAYVPTTDPDAPLGIAARKGDPVVLTVGDEQFELP